MVTRLSQLSMNLIISYIPLEPACKRCQSIWIDHVSFETRQLFHEKYAGRSHCKGSRSKAICFINIGTYYRQADDTGNRLVVIPGIVNMFAAHVCAGSRYPAIPQREHFYDFFGVKGILNPNAPILALGVLAGHLDIAAAIDIIVFKSGLPQDFGGSVYRPPFNNPGWVIPTILINVEKTLRF